jgi:hypothetical protein
MITTEGFVLLIFSGCNALRVLAYVPQMWKLAQPGGDAKSVSCATWLLFFVSHLSTVAYLLTVTGDRFLAASFALNAAACLAIVTLTLAKRRRAAQLPRFV